MQRRKRGEEPAPTADPEDARRFLRGLRDKTHDLAPEEQEAAVREYVESFSLGELKGIGRRIMMDLMRPPRPRRGDEAEPESETAPPKGESRPRRPRRQGASRRR